MKKNIISVAGTALLAIGILSGCGQAQNASNAASSPSANKTSAQNKTPSSPTNKSLVIGGGQYKGKKNLKKYEDAAKKSPKSVQAQINAGVAAHVNGNDTKAISYYKKAAALSPKNAIPYNNIGNIYLRDKGNAKKALPYYKKATTVQPSYSYGWLNLALTQAKLGKKSEAKKTVATGLKKTKKSDPVYKMLLTEQKKLNK